MKKILVGLIILVMLMGCGDKQQNPWDVGQTIYSLNNTLVYINPNDVNANRPYLTPPESIIDTLCRDIAMVIDSDSSNTQKTMLHVRYYDGEHKTGFVRLGQVSLKKSEQRVIEINDLLANLKKTKKDELYFVYLDESNDRYIPLDYLLSTFPLRQRKLMETSIRLNEIKYIAESGEQGIVKFLGSEYVHTDFYKWLDQYYREIAQ